MRLLQFVYLVVAVIAMISTVITTRRITLRAKRRMHKALGNTVGDADLASINTWMKVRAVEQLAKQRRR
jgi:hypothetical protein